MDGLFRSLVVGIDGSDSSLRAARQAIVVAKRCGATLCAVYVVDTATIARLTISRVFVETEAELFRSSLESTGRRYLDFVAELARAKGLGSECILTHGSVATELLAAASARQADCLVLGGWDHGRSSLDPLSRCFREIMAHANLPLLISCGAQADRMYDLL